MRKTKEKWEYYTLEAEAYLREKWGVHLPWQVVGAINRMTKDKKTFENIAAKARRMGLGTIRDAYNLITVADIGKAFNVNNIGTFRRWGIPCKSFNKGSKYLVVDIKQFWKWAEDNKHRIDFKKYEVGSILPEPKWLREYTAQQKIKEYHLWTIEEEAALKIYKANGKNSDFIAKKLGLTKNQINSKLKYMKAFKATTLNRNYKKVTVEEKQKALQLRAQGLAYAEIMQQVDISYATLQRICGKAAKEAKEAGTKDE